MGVDRRAILVQVKAAPIRIVVETVEIDLGTLGVRDEIGTKTLARREQAVELRQNRLGSRFERRHPIELRTLVKLALRQFGEVEAVRLLIIYLLLAEHDVERLGEPRAKRRPLGAEPLLQMRAIAPPQPRRFGPRARHFLGEIAGQGHALALLDRPVVEAAGGAGVAGGVATVALQDQRADIARIGFEDRVDRPLLLAPLAERAAAIGEHQRDLDVVGHARMNLGEQPPRLAMATGLEGGGARARGGLERGLGAHAACPP
ncbi:MAG: hypothetical protein K2X76_11005 [Sphingomonas sp.]|nr:hypothetical protein [Sphingomonas sp.]